LSNQPHIKWTPKLLSFPGETGGGRGVVMVVVHEADYPSPSSVEVKKVWGCTSRLLHAFKTCGLIKSIVKTFNKIIQEIYAYLTLNLPTTTIVAQPFLMFC
jgi:hypothetical protein